METYLIIFEDMKLIYQIFNKFRTQKNGTFKYLTNCKHKKLNLPIFNKLQTQKKMKHSNI